MTVKKIYWRIRRKLGNTLATNVIIDTDGAPDANIRGKQKISIIISATRFSRNNLKSNFSCEWNEREDSLAAYIHLLHVYKVTTVMGLKEVLSHKSLSNLTMTRTVSFGEAVIQSFLADSITQNYVSYAVLTALVYDTSGYTLFQLRCIPASY